MRLCRFGGDILLVMIYNIATLIQGVNPHA
jgi:hypothetical protein